MAQLLTASVVQQIGSLFDGGLVTGLSDRQLIERFVARRDAAGEAAFSALVARHGPMVLGVCRQFLGDHHDAEDAFQAVFLVLARRARFVRDPELLSHWLYGVALRTARKARSRLRRRLQREEVRGDRLPEACSTGSADQPVIDRESAEALHEEIDRLPTSSRLPVVLCYFEGLSLSEAAARLRCPAGTVHSRLVRARDKLRRGLARRGFVLSGSAIAAMLAPRRVSASISTVLCDSTTRSAIRFVVCRGARDACSTCATALAKEVLRAALLHKLRAAALSLVLLATLACAGGYLTPLMKAAARSGEGEPQSNAAPTEPRPPGPVTIAGGEPRPAPGRMFVAGRVFNPDGKPVAKATTMVYASLRRAGRGDRLAPVWPSAIGQAQSNGSGQFRLDAPRVSSARHDVFGLIAIAPGFGAGWVALDPDAERPSAEITLRPEQVIQGRLFDVQGRPVRGVTISVENMGVIPSRSPETIEQAEPYFLPDLSEKLPAWPRPATTDADGRFTIRGAGRGLRLGLVIDDPRFARLRFDVDTDGPGDTRLLTMAVEPARVISGRVRYADTGEPVPHAHVEVETHLNGGSGWAGDFETDVTGCFRANPGAADHYSVTVFAPDGTPYLTLIKDIDWPKPALEQTVDLTLPRGVCVRGKVTEEGCRRPIAGARISYICKPDRDRRFGVGNGRASTALDGSFQLGVMANPGYLTVLAPGEDYALQEIGRNQALSSQPGGSRLYSHAFHKLDLKPGSATQEVAVALRPSASVACRIVGPDGRPVRDAAVFSRVILQPTWIAWLIWRSSYRGTVLDGHFVVHGLEPDAEVPVYFLDAKHNLGATALLCGKLAACGPVKVALQPCGAARARLVDLAGKPVPRSRDNVRSHMTMMVITAGPHWSSQENADQGRLTADQDLLTRFDPVHYPKGLISNDRGELLLPALIPGATYRIYDGTMGEEAERRLRREFTVNPGETLDLGDILIEKPDS